MVPMQLIALIGIVFIILVLGVLLLIPTEGRRVKKKRTAEKSPEEQMKEWQHASLKLEKHVISLREELDGFKKRERATEKELLLAKEKNKKLQEKMSQERGWQEKEQTDLEKKSKEIHTLKDDLKKSEQVLEKEHSQRLLLEREAKEIKENITREVEAKRAAEAMILKLKAQADAYREEIFELREKNDKLSKTHEDKTFVAKSEYEKLEQLIKEKDKEIEKLKKN